MTSQRHFGTSPFQLTGLSLLSHAHVEVGVSFKMAWYPPSQNTLHVSPMRMPVPVGYGNIGSFDTAEATVPEIAPSPSDQLAVQDFPETVFGPS